MIDSLLTYLFFCIFAALIVAFLFTGVTVAMELHVNPLSQFIYGVNIL